MLKRVKIDLSFDNEDIALSLITYAKKLSSKAVNINEGQPNEEIGFIELIDCGHIEGKPCEVLDRVEIRTLLPEQVI